MYEFVVRREDNSEEFIRTYMGDYGITNIEIVSIDDMTDGQATTCMPAIPYCDTDEEILVYNIDTYVEPYEMKYKDISGDGHIPCFHAEGDHRGYVKLIHVGTRSK